jgi:hypothetical protein
MRNRLRAEFEILNENVKDAIVSPFEDEIIALVEKFNNSGQSGGSAPFTASAVSQAVKNLCLQEPLYGIMNTPEEWNDDIEAGTFQNNRLSSVFKHSADGKPYYLDAIVFKGQNGSCFTGNGSTTTRDGKTLSSRQFIKSFPFKPKSFYIDVIETEWADKTETVKKEGGGWWTSIVKDERQLEEVWEYYDKL